MVTSAEIAHDPGRQEHPRPTRTRFVNLYHPRQYSQLEQGIPVLHTVTGNIADGPHGMIDYLGISIINESPKELNATPLDHNLTVTVIPRGNIGENPGGLDLQPGVLVLIGELNELGHEVGVDDVLDCAVLRDRH